MRVRCALGTALLAAITLVVSILDNSAEGIAFFSAAAPGAAIQAWAVREPYGGVRRRVAIALAVTWLVAAVWIGVLLVAYQSASRPPPEIEATYFGLPATAYRLVALYGGAVLVAMAALLPRSQPRPDIVRSG